MESTDPIALFAQTFQQAVDAGIMEPNAMALATASADGRPSVRIVLLKGYDHDGFVFYTNLQSRKGSQLHENPHAALCFFWQTLGKQIRIEGTVTQVDDTEADAYFATRPRGSQLAAWASDQSRPLASRDDLLERFERSEEQYGEGDVPRPAYWSGFRLVPERIEFWTAGEFRLHSRLLFERADDGSWQSRGLYP